MLKKILVTIGTALMVSGGTAWAQQDSLGPGSFVDTNPEAVVKAEPAPAAEPSGETFVTTRVETTRPAALPMLYASLGVMQALDVVTTFNALKAGAREQNPMIAQFGGNTAAMIAYKSVMTAGTIVAVERMWKKNRVGAVLMAVAANGVTAAVAAHNLRVTRAQRAR